MDGLLIVDKPRGCTSHDVVLRIRSLLKLKRVGHGGTLDPDATGILLVALGQATRFFPYLSGQDKTYEGAIRLGFATDTYDASGRQAAEEKADSPPLEAVVAAMGSLEGEILQVPPPLRQEDRRKPGLQAGPGPERIHLGTRPRRRPFVCPPELRASLRRIRSGLLVGDLHPLLGP